MLKHLTNKKNQGIDLEKIRRDFESMLDDEYVGGAQFEQDIIEFMEEEMKMATDQLGKIKREMTMGSFTWTENAKSRILVFVPHRPSENISIKVKAKELLITSKENKGSKQASRAVGRSQRRFPVPDDVDAEGVEIKFSEGTYRIIFPKK